MLGRIGVGYGKIGSGRKKPTRLNIERKLVLTAKYEIVHGLSIAVKLYDLE